MSLLSELNAIAESCGVPVETGIFSDTAPDTYLVLTPLSENIPVSTGTPQLSAMALSSDSKLIPFRPPP